MALVRGEPLLFDPDRVLPGATPPSGAYRCRVYKLGANGTAMRNVTTYPAVDCMIEDEGDVSSLYKVSGTQRPVGLVFPDSKSRAIFLGTMVLGDETKPLDYGQDAHRDLAGYIERIGPHRWRLVLPRPRFESLLDVVEIVPAARPLGHGRGRQDRGILALFGPDVDRRKHRLGRLQRGLDLLDQRLRLAHR